MADPLPSPACPDCGAPLPPASPQALCPACLMRQALASRTIIHDGDKLPQLTPPSPEEIADKFPGYEILECLGRGGMGVVYKARQKSLNRLVAIKILAPERVDDSRFAERFTIEAELLAKLSHPHIVTIHDFGETGGLFYLVMEFIDGVNLRDLLRDGKLEPAQALAIVPPICDALQYAHDKGIVHRDIKPENLLLDRDGRIKIADFGIAKLIEPLAVPQLRDRTSPEESQQSAATINAGTLGYSAPEQTSDPQHVDQRADIYSLGVVLYEMLTGERPNKQLIAPSKKVQIDVRLDEIVLRALEKTPALRYQTAGEFRTVLQTMIETTLTTPPSSAKVLHGAEREEGCDPSRPQATFTDAEGARQARISPLYHRPRSLRDCWPWDANFLSGVTAILVSFPVILALGLMPVLGAKSLLFLILELIPLLYVVVYFSILKRVDRLRAKVTPDAREIAEGLFATRVLQTPCLAILADDRLELLGLAGQPIIIPLSDIEAVTVIRWFNGRRLWWKGCLKIERRSAPAIAIALAESVSLRWKPYLTGEVRQQELIPPKDRISPSPEIQSCFSRTAIVGACWLAFIPLHFLFPLIVPAGWQNNALIELLAMLQALLFWTAPVGVTFLGWIAVSQIRRSAGKLHGLWLAVLEGLLFPLLTLDAILLAVPVMALKRIPWHGMIPIWVMLLIGLGIMALITSNVFIIRRVWRAVNSNIPTAPQQTGSTDKPSRFTRKAIHVAACVFAALSLAVLFTKQWNGRKREGEWVPARISQTITEQYGDAQVRVVDVSQAGQVVVVSFTCEMFRTDRNLLVMYGGPVLSYPNDLIPSVQAKVTDLDCLITPRAKVAGDSIGELLVGTNVLTGRKMFRIGFVLPDAQTAEKIVKAVQETHLGKPRGLGEGGSVLLLFSLRRDSGKDAAGKPVVESLDATLWSGAISGTSQLRAQTVFGLQPVIELTFPMNEDGETDMLDPETGQIIPSPNRDGSEASRKGLLIQHDAKADKTVLVGMNGVIPQLSRADQWAEITNFQALETLKNNFMGKGGSVGAVVNGPAPHTFLFKTGNGRIGILQITRFIENPRGVEVRYKMVQPSRFIRKTGGYQLGEAGSVVLTPSSDGKVTLAVTMVEGTNRDTNTVPDFCKKEGWFVYIESPKRVWAFDGIRQLDLLTPGGREAVGGLYIRALCPAAVWDAVPESVRKFYREPQGKPAGTTSSKQAAATSLDPARPLESLAAATKELVVKYFPDAQVSLSDDEFTASHATQKFQIHNQSKTGEATPDAAKETGPSFTGFILQISRKDNADISQAAVPQTLREPYWSTFINSGYNPASKRGVWIRYAFGGRVDPEFHKQMLELLSLSAMGSEGFGAGTTLGVFNNTGAPAAVTPQPPEDPAWGAPDNGASVRLRADKAQWTGGEIPSLKMDLRNLGNLDLTTLQSHEFGKLEADGVAYRWTGACRLTNSPFPPGRVYTDIPVTLGAEWMQARDRTEATPPPPLRLAPGRHVVRFAPAIGVPGAAKGGKGPTVSCISNPVEIEILDSKDPATVIPMVWGEAVNGVSVHLQADLTTWTADESPVMAAHVRNHGAAALPLSTGPIGNELEVDGKWHAWNPSGNTDLPQHSELAPGTECAIPLTLSGDWQSQSVPLSLGLGQHVIRFAIRAKSATGEESLRVISNPIRLDIADGISRRAALVARYLPGYQFRFVRNGPAGLEEVLVAPDGSKVNLAEIRNGWGNFPNPSLTAFILPLQLKVATAAEAQDITRIVMTVLTGGGNMEDWEFRAKSSPSGWQVEMVYVGPPAQIWGARPIELILQDGQLVDVANAETKPAPMIMHIHLAANGALTVAGEPCPADQLADRLKKLAGQESVSIKLHADKKAPFRQVQAVLDACAAAGLKDIAFDVENP